jgi:hypothetical protein
MKNDIIFRFSRIAIFLILCYAILYLFLGDKVDIKIIIELLLSFGTLFMFIDTYLPRVEINQN